MRSAAPLPALVVCLGACFNVANGALNGAWAAHLGPLPASWLAGPWFWIGAALFAAGYTLNRHSDYLLRALRRPGETGYAVPHGGGFRWVSAPNYLGELVEWVGFAIAAASPAAWGFVVFTAANLVPRAASNHRWYREHFPDHPPRRRALIPFLW